MGEIKPNSLLIHNGREPVNFLPKETTGDHGTACEQQGLATQQSPVLMGANKDSFFGLQRTPGAVPLLPR